MEPTAPSMRAEILIIEDDQRLARLTQEFLENNGYRVEVCHDGKEGGSKILSDKPDLVILDLMLPGEDGLSICRRVRPQFKGPILMLTAKTDDINQVLGLELGADDYVAKPVPPQVLLARTRALLRRIDSTSGDSPETITLGNIEIDKTQREVMVNGKPVEFTSAEFDLLWLLMLNAGKILTREDILGSTRGIAYDGLDRTIDVRVSKVRKKVGDDLEMPRIIKTIRGKGYIFVKEAV